MFYLNTIEQLFLFVKQLDQLEVCLPYNRLITGIPILAVFQNLRWNSNKTSLPMYFKQCNRMKMFFKKCADGENFVDLVVMETFVSICFRKSLTVVSTIVVEIFI